MNSRLTPDEERLANLVHMAFTAAPDSPISPLVNKHTGQRIYMPVNSPLAKRLIGHGWIPEIDDDATPSPDAGAM